MDLLRVLVVDDDHDTADALVDLMVSLGTEARAAYDGPSAVALARAYQPHVLICDVNLPGYDGFQVARTLRADPSTAGIKLVALTGYSEREVGERLREAGYDTHLVKPISVPTLEAALTR